MDIKNLETHLKVSPSSKPRRITILGSTGSVGSNTVELIQNNLDSFTVEAITANRNIDLLINQALSLTPKSVVLADPQGYNDLKVALAGTGINVSAGADAVVEAAEQPSDLVMASIVGAA